MNKLYIRENTQLPPFLPLPKFILRENLSITAKLVYGLLFNRSMLSQQQHWTDEEGRIYVIYTLEQLAEDAGRSVRSVATALGELEKGGLIQRMRRGVRKANLIFVQIPETAYVTCKNCTGDMQKPAHHDVQNLHGSKTDLENNNLSKTDGGKRPSLGPYKNVVLSKEQLAALRKEYPARVDAYIGRLSAYMARSGKRYADHQAVLRKWMAEDAGDTRCEYSRIYEEGECL